MRESRRFPISFRGGLLAVALVLGGVPAAADSPPPPGADPVEDLKRALQFRLEDLRNPNALTFREENVRKRIGALKTIGDLRRALLLTDWKDDQRNPELAAVDKKLR